MGSYQHPESRSGSEATGADGSIQEWQGNLPTGDYQVNIKKWLVSKRINLNAIGGSVLAYVVANPAMFGITGPQAIAFLAVANIIVHAMDKNPPMSDR